MDKDLVRTEYSKVWGTKKMIDYSVNSTAEIAELPNDDLIPVKKHKIETRFCFGESGYDYDDALKAAQHARTSEDYFKRENMRDYNDRIQSITDSMNDTGNTRLIVYTGGAYYGQKADCRIRNIGFARLSDIIDACGGSCYLDELYGKELKIDYQDCRIATLEEHRIILEAYQAAAKAHEKKVNAYLKRYGTSKVHAWTYWRDAW